MAVRRQAATMMRRRVKGADQERLVLGILPDVVFILFAVFLVNICSFILYGHGECMLHGL